MQVWLRWMSGLVALILLSTPGMASARRDHLNADLAEIADEGTLSSGPEIHLNAGTFDPLAEPGLKLAGLETLSTVEEEAATTYLLQFTGPVREAWKTQVAALGVRLYTYVPDYAFIARLDPAQIEAVRALTFVRWVGVYQPAYRLAETFRAAAATSGAMDVMALEDPLEVTVQALPDADLDALAGQIAALGGKVTRRAQRMTASVLRVEISPANIEDIAALDEVLWVEPYLPPALLNDVGGGSIMRVTDVRANLGLYGAGQIVGVADSGLDVGTTGSAMSDDFEGRIVHAEATCQYFGMRTTWHDFDGHGTHVAGSVLGNGLNSGSTPSTHDYSNSFAGVAPEAQLVFQAVDNEPGGGLECIPIDLDTYLFGVAYQEGARIHNNSWGGPTGGTWDNPQYGGYDESSQAADDSAWNRKDLLILFAAGNSGIDANADGLVDPDSIGSPGTAKNVLTVGATESLRSTSVTWGSGWPEDYPVDPIFSDHIADNQDGMAAFSSRGPTDDGRIKPEVAAPGTFIISTRSHDSNAGTGWGVYDADYLYMGGTSMATPLTAGGAAVVREWLVKQGGVSNPSAALLKAMLINGAADMSPGQYTSPQEIPAQRPNTVAGWGRVDLLETVAPTGNRSLWYADTTTGLATGATAEYPLTVAAGETLRVTLAWTDYPGSPWVSRQLVNDLDLEVIGPDSTSYYGNNGAYATGHGCLRNGQWDQCNNVESVIIPSAAAGSYTVRVHAQNVPNGPQPFALAASANFGAANTAPTLSGLPDQTLNAGQTLDNAIDLHNYASDAEDAVADLTFSIISALPTGLNVQIDGNRYVDITAASDFSGAASVEIQVEDTGGLTASDTFTVTVSAVNTAPTLSGLPDQIVSPDGWEQAIDLWAYADDNEDDVANLTFSIVSQTPVNLTTISSNRYIDINPPSGYTGTAQVQVQVADTGDLTATDTFDVEVTEENIPPELTFEDVVVEIDQTQNVDLRVYVADRNDMDGPFTFTVQSVSPGDFIAEITDTHYLYLEPPAGWSGTAQVEIQVEDPAGATATDTLNVTVQAANTAPMLSGLPDQIVWAGQTKEGAIDLWAYANDAEDDDANLTFSLVGSPPPDAGVSINANRYIDIRPDDSYEGDVTIEVQVQDTGHLTATDDFLLTVKPGGRIYLPLVVKVWPPIPATPTLYAIENADGDGAYTVNWSTAARADSYILQEDDNVNFSSPQEVYHNFGLSWNATGKSPGAYYYRVKARNTWGDSGWSVVRSVSVAPPSTFYATQDACILQGYPTENFGNTTDMWVGYDDSLNPDGKVARSLIQFDTSVIPAGTPIANAVLRVHLISSWDYPDRSRTITTYRIGSPWSESSVTWNTSPPIGEAYGSASVTHGSWGWYSFNVTHLVRAWVNGTPNRGVMLRGPEWAGSDSSWKGFSTREGDYAPQLVITYGGSSRAAAIELEDEDISIGQAIDSIAERLNGELNVEFQDTLCRPYTSTDEKCLTSPIE